MQRWDLGEIIRNHTYVREISSTWNIEKCLFSSTDLLRKLGRIYDYLGIKWSIAKELHVRVKLPDSSNSLFRDCWQETTIRRSDEKPLITIIDSFTEYDKKEVVLASSAWMGHFDSFPGDEIVISPYIPVLQIS
ncbi:hypothetical protein ACFL0D_02680 [Thermoproteota archaeon]